MLFWGITVSLTGVVLLDSSAVLILGGIIVIGGLAKLSVRQIKESARIDQMLNVVTVLLLGSALLWHGIAWESFTLLMSGIALIGMASALLLPEYGRLLGSVIATSVFSVLVVHYGQSGDWLIAAAIIILIFIFGRMSFKEWKTREEQESK